LAYQLAYSVSFALGYTFNSLIVFRKPWAWGKLQQFPAVYVVQYVIGFFDDKCIG